MAEAALPHPESPYAQSKLDGKGLCLAACEGGLDTGVLRFFNVYGPRQDPSSDYSGVIAIFMERLAAGRRCTVYGDGHQTRDFVFVKDVVAACRAALDGRMLGGRPLAATPINVGTGIETSLRRRAGGARPGERSGARRALCRRPRGRILRSRAACQRAAELLGFRAAVAFPAGLATTWSWYLSAAATRAR